MGELTRERRRALRDQVQLYGFTKSGMKHAELMALFDAADREEKLREANARAKLSGDDSALVAHADGSLGLLLPATVKMDDLPHYAVFIAAVFARAKQHPAWVNEMLEWLEMADAP